MHWGRAVPLAWRVVEHEIASVSFDAYHGYRPHCIGLEWTKVVLFNNWQLIQQVAFTSHCDPELAIAVKFLPD